MCPGSCVPGTDCVCYDTSAAEHVVDCTSAGILTVPLPLPPNTTLLNLRSNHLEDLPPRAFAAAPRLKKLFLMDNSIRRVDQAAFAGLPELQQLRLSNNDIFELRENTFLGLDSLQEL